MDIAVLLTLLGGVALAVNRITELLKPAIEQLPEGYQGPAIRIVSILIGIGLTLGGGESFNLLAISPVYGQLNPYAGLIITGVIVGGFSNGWDKIASLFNPTATTSSSESVTIEKTSTRTEPPPVIG